MAVDDLESRVGKLERAVAAYSAELRLAFRYIHSDAGSSLTKSRLVMEKLLRAIYTTEMGQEPRKPLLGEMLADNQFTRRIERRILSRMNAIRDMGNLGPHGEPVESSDAAKVLDDLCEVLDWYLRRYGSRSPISRQDCQTPAPSLPDVAHSRTTPESSVVPRHPYWRTILLILLVPGILFGLALVVSVWFPTTSPTKPTPAKLTAEHEGHVVALVFTDNSHVLTAGDDGAKLWDVSSGRWTLEFGRGLKFNPPALSKSVLAASTTTDFTDGLIVWSLKDGSRLQDFRTEFPGVMFSKQVAFHPSGNLLAFGVTDRNESAPGQIKIWNLSTKKVERTLSVAPTTGIGSYGYFVWVGFTPDGQKLLGITFPDMGKDLPGRFIVWETNTGKKLYDQMHSSYTFYGASVTADGNYLATASSVDMEVWNINTGEPVKGPQGRSSFTQMSSISPDGTKLFTSKFNEGAVLTFPTQEVMYQLQDGPISCAWHPHASRFATGHGSDANPSASVKVVIRDANSGLPLSQFVGHTKPVTQVQFSPDGRLLAGCSYEGHLCVWDVE